MNQDAALSTFESIAAFSDYIAELALQDLAPNTFARYKQRLRSFQAWLEERPVSARAAKLFLAEMRERGYSPKSIRLYYVPIRAFLEYLGIPLKVKFRRQRHLPAYHSAEDLQKILDVIDARIDKWARNKERDKLIILMLALTGLRRAEFVALRPHDITNGYIYVRSGKGDKDRVIPLSTILQKPLSAYIRKQGIGTSSRIFPITASRLYRLVKYYAQAAGIDDLSPHGLRHYFATALVEREAPLRAVQELLGHSNIATTSIYLDIIPAHLKSTIALLDESVSLSTNKNIFKSSTKYKHKRLSLSLSNERKGAPCGLKLKRGRPLMPPSTSVPLRVSPSIGQGRDPSFAWGRDAPIALIGFQKGGVIRPDFLLLEPQSVGNSESKP